MEASTAPAAAESIVAALVQAGTRLMFGVPGGGPNLDVVGAAEAAGIRFVLAHGETAATIMAATSADLTGAPGAVVVTRGPGLTSAVNGIAHAALDRLPVVVIADTVAAADAGRISHQRIDQAALGRSVAKAAVTVAGPAAAAGAVAIARAAPAGPVIANMDDSAAGRDGSPGRRRAENGVEAQTLRAAQDTAARAGRALLAEAARAARRPVVLLGTGAIPRTAAVRAALAGRGIPALHTYRARGVLPDSAAEAAGLVTGGTMEWPLLSAADLIVGLGVDEAEMIPARWDYPARTILVAEPGAPPARGWFTGAAELTMPLTEALDVLAAGPGPDWPADAGRAARRDAARRLAAAAAARPGRLAPQQVVATARACAPPETIATVDAGAHMLVAMPLWEVPGPRMLLTSSGLATMGYALPAAIAAALCLPRAQGAPEAPVLAFTGDGGLGMTLAEIETAVRLSLRVVVIVFNDAALSLIKIKQRPAGQGGEEAVRYRPVSFAAAAAALGAAGAAVGTERELAAALTDALARPGPTVIDASVDPACYPAVMDLSRGQAGRRSVPGISRTSHPKEHAMSITVAKFRDVADGVQPGQFMIGDREPVASLTDLDPIYKRLLDEPVTAIVAVTGSDGQPNLTPVWFDYEGDTVLLNLATHRKKVPWLRKVPHATFLLMNPENTYHWLSLKTEVRREISEDDPAEGQRVTDQLDRIWVKYTGNEPPYALRDPSMDERRVLFELEVVKVATFGRP